MARAWVLHTETKGTGAQMVPLESVRKRSTATEPVFVPRNPSGPRKPRAPEPRQPHRFRIVDLMSREVLADDADAREAVNALKTVRSNADVSVYAWEERRERWRLLTLSEQRAIWDLAHA
jgi:hypothetical protein